MGNLIRMQLLRDKQVKFAGYIHPHPLIHRIELRVQTLDRALSTPMQVGSEGGREGGREGGFGGKKVDGREAGRPAGPWRPASQRISFPPPSFFFFLSYVPPISFSPWSPHGSRPWRTLSPISTKNLQDSRLASNRKSDGCRRSRRIGSTDRSKERGREGGREGLVKRHTHKWHLNARFSIQSKRRRYLRGIRWVV
jgi:hypothetical protein